MYVTVRNVIESLNEILSHEFRISKRFNGFWMSLFEDVGTVRIDRNIYCTIALKTICETRLFDFSCCFFSAETLPLYTTCHHFSLLNTDGWIASHWMREHAQTIESEVIFSIRKLKLKLNSTELERDKDHLRLYFYYNLFSGHKNTRFICFLFDFSSSIIILLHYSIMRLLVVFVQNDCVFPV